jgi:predicted nuclease of restriction endonuclease-like RecB superfamily
LLPRPIAALSYTLRGSEIIPTFFDTADHVVIRAVLDEYQAFAGQKRSLLHERLAKPLPVRVKRAKLAILRHVLDGMTRDQSEPIVDPVLARRLVFRAAQGRSLAREKVLEQVGRELEVSALTLEEVLFADLPREQRVGPLPALTPEDVVLDANLAIAGTLLRRALRVRIQIHGHAASVVRQAQRSGLICSATSGGRDSVGLEISGPFALFRHTILYARALAQLLTGLAACYEWELEAACSLDAGPTLHRLVLSSRDPLPRRASFTPSGRVEQRFVRELSAATRNWDVVTDPDAIVTDSGLLFPDLELMHRRTGERWFIEILGFSTPEHVEEKLARLAQAGIENAILCLDTNRQCGVNRVRECVHVLGYRHRIDVKQVLAIVESRAPVRRDVA